jgi:HEAT repeat protein
MNNPALSSVFIAHLKDPAASVRLQCARALGMLRPSSAVPALVAVLADPDWHVSYAARDALVYIGAPAVTALIGAMSSDNPRTRLYAQQALVGVGDGAIEPAIKALASQNTATRLGAVLVLGKLGGQRAVKALQTLDKDPNETVRNQVSRALSTIGA